MFWTIMLYIYIGISTLCFLLNILLAINGYAKLKQKHPKATYEKEPKITFFVSWLRILIFSILPIINFILVCVYLFKWEDMLEEIINKTEVRIIEESIDT